MGKSNMSWVYRFDERALKDLRKLGKQVVGDEDPQRPHPS
jgi:hypothetical protein